ncbi:hypothetical protein M0R04_11910 [Candidatus Dojkabacteria bacterium]|jgi:hypothetical protein|nr:hypothetical protein [Candidatus Dojkabacteria bacterium]
MYTIKLLDNEEYNSLPYKKAKTSYGCADPKSKVAYIRKTGVDIFDLGTIQHEIDELVAKVSPHEIDGIRYKGGDEPQYTPPPPPKYKTVQELFDPAIAFAKKETPLAYGARESGLADLAKGTSYYEGFQPTSLEQTLGNQYFQNVMPDVERSISHQASLRGLEGTVVPISEIAKQRGNLGVSIGQYLANLGNSRATNSLNARLGINPYSTYQPYLQTDIGQSNTQSTANYNYDKLLADLAYQQAMQEYENEQQGISGMFGAGGAGIGALLAGALAIPTGGMSLAALPAVLGAAGAGAGLGSSLGGSMAPLFGGSSGGGMGIGDALSLFNAMGGKGMFGSTGQAQPVNSGLSSMFSNAQSGSLGGMDIGSLLSSFSLGGF